MSRRDITGSREPLLAPLTHKRNPSMRFVNSHAECERRSARTTGTPPYVAVSNALHLELRLRVREAEVGGDDDDAAIAELATALGALGGRDGERGGDCCLLARVALDGDEGLSLIHI